MSFRDRAIRLLEVAISYADDGAPNTAISRAEEAISELRKEAARREKIFGTGRGKRKES